MPNYAVAKDAQNKPRRDDCVGGMGQTILRRENDTTANPWSFWKASKIQLVDISIMTRLKGKNSPNDALTVNDCINQIE